MAKFDPFMKEHLRRIQEKELSDTYLSKHIQNELISHVAKSTLDAIVEKVKRAKYFAVIMDCTPDISHNEQLSVVLRIVNCELNKGVSIHEHFVGFLLAEDITGKGLLELFLGHLETLHLDISDCRGQSYDNGSNMQGKNQGVQKRVLDLNPKALCVPCGSHTLNLVIGDAAKSSTISLKFFGVLLRLYNLFSGSVQRWAILQVNVKDFTIKALSTTRWECRVEAVKAVWYQLPDILNALEALHDFAIEKSDSECASSASSLCRELKKWPFMVNMYLIVLFEKESKTGPVAKEWFSDGLAWWPQYSDKFKILKSVQKKVAPNPSKGWKQFAARVLYESDSIDKIRENWEWSCVTSDLNRDREQDNTPVRQRRKSPSPSSHQHHQRKMTYQKYNLAHPKDQKNLIDPLQET
ncbi:zinc finger MYM-type protein 1-like [Siphateles boraxobius]|uniref:zinc finger MYM-type protein 1-like n=1 Tax=Siphateles boraxobius TaxID=180520 RepID=UPI00406431D3